MAEVTEQTARIIEELIPDGDLDEKVRRLLLNEIRRKLVAFEVIDRRFQKKYGMNLADFEKREVIKSRGYSFEVESDYHEWDQAVDSIQVLKDNLLKLLAK